MANSDELDNEKEITLIQDIDIEEDVPAALEHFLMLSMVGMYQDGQEYFDRILSRHLHAFPVFAEYADFLIQARNRARLRQLLEQPIVDGFSEDNRERGLVVVLRALSQAWRSDDDIETLAYEDAVQAQLSVVCAECPYLQNYLKDNVTIDHLPDLTTVRILSTFSILCRGDLKPGFIEPLYHLLIQEDLLWEAQKLFTRFFTYDEPRFLELADAAEESPNTDLASISYIAAANQYSKGLLGRISSAVGIGPTEELGKLLAHQKMTEAALVRLPDVYANGSLVQSWLYECTRIPEAAKQRLRTVRVEPYNLELFSDTIIQAKDVLSLMREGLIPESTAKCAVLLDNLYQINRVLELKIEQPPPISSTTKIGRDNEMQKSGKGDLIGDVATTLRRVSRVPRRELYDQES